VHRIIRRSTTYGALYDPDATSEDDDEVAHGIYFIFISAKAMETMEFLQREWINDGNFMSLTTTPSRLAHGRCYGARP
jgi:deferrochelatase/peroxidase EfeB